MSVPTALKFLGGSSGTGREKYETTDLRNEFYTKHEVVGRGSPKNCQQFHYHKLKEQTSLKFGQEFHLTLTIMSIGDHCDSYKAQGIMGVLISCRTLWMCQRRHNSFEITFSTTNSYQCIPTGHEFKNYSIVHFLQKAYGEVTEGIVCV